MYAGHCLPTDVTHAPTRLRSIPVSHGCGCRGGIRMARARRRSTANPRATTGASAAASSLTPDDTGSRASRSAEPETGHGRASPCQAWRDQRFVTPDARRRRSRRRACAAGPEVGAGEAGKDATFTAQAGVGGRRREVSHARRAASEQEFTARSRPCARRAGDRTAVAHAGLRRERRILCRPPPAPTSNLREHGRVDGGRRQRQSKVWRGHEVAGQRHARTRHAHLVGRPGSRFGTVAACRYRLASAAARVAEQPPSRSAPTAVGIQLRALDLIPSASATGIHETGMLVGVGASHDIRSARARWPPSRRLDPPVKPTRRANCLIRPASTDARNRRGGHRMAQVAV